MISIGGLEVYCYRSFFAPSSQDIIRIALFHTHMVLVLVKHLSKSPGSQVIHQIPMVSS